MAGVLVVLGGLLVLIGWVTDVPVLTSFVPGWLAMKVNTAIAFVFSGLALILLVSPEISPARLQVGRIFAALAAVLGLLTLLQYPLDRDFGIDQFLIPETPGAVQTVHLGRMAPATALCFVTAGLALLLPVRFGRTFQILVHITGLLAVISACHFAYLGRPLLPYTPMALHTAGLFLILAAGLLATRAESGPIAILCSDSAGGQAARWLLPAATLLPLFLGWLLLRGGAFGWYDFATGTLLFAVSAVAILGGLVWIHALRLHRADLVRNAATAKNLAQLARLHLLQQITRAIGERQDPHSIYQVVVRQLEESLPLDFCAILLRSDGGKLRIAHVGVLAPEVGAELVRVDAGFTLANPARLLYEPDLAADTAGTLGTSLRQAGLRALVLAPLAIEDNVFGVVLAARRHPASFSSGECEFLSQAAAHTALAAHQALLRHRLQEAYDELRATQQTVLQQERLGALGQMASGIAHDINNALTPAVLYAEFIRKTEPSLKPKSLEHLQNVQQAIANVAQTVARLRDFSRSQAANAPFAPVNLNHLIAEVVRLTRARWSDMPQKAGVVIEMVQELASDLPALDCAESEIRDSLTNLIFNAVDAMPHGGRLTIRTRLLPAHRRQVTLHRLVLEVTDTGTGMDEKTRRHCLEPFFTTKGQRGTGLGLAMVYGTAQRHNAALEIDSTPGQGTTFRLSFALPKAHVAPVATSTLSGRPTRTLRLLLIDDDPLILRSLHDLLASDGHTVTACPGGQEGFAALTSAQAHSEHFDAVITDLGMPQIDGRTVAAAVKMAGPTPVILLTGWGQRMRDDHELPPHIDLILPKPPRVSDLRAALAQLCT